jgi:hypothetical protein
MAWSLSVFPSTRLRNRSAAITGSSDLDLTAVGKLLQQRCDGPNPTQPTLFITELCHFRKLDGLCRKGSPQHKPPQVSKRRPAGAG